MNAWMIAYLIFSAIGLIILLNDLQGRTKITFMSSSFTSIFIYWWFYMGGVFTPLNGYIVTYLLYSFVSLFWFWIEKTVTIKNYWGVILFIPYMTLLILGGAFS